jgi:MFS family permease
MKQPEKLWSFEFVSLTVITLLAFCNISIFYSFYNYLERIGVPPAMRGLLLGLEPLAAFVLRPMISPLLQPRNCIRWMLAGLLLTAAALLTYPRALTIASLAVVRVVHGAGFVILISAAVALMVQFIPRQKSAQGFGIFSIAAQLPYAIMPLMTEALLKVVDSEAQVYAAASLLALPPAILLLLLKRRIGAALDAFGVVQAQRPTLQELKENLRQFGVLMILAVNFFMFLSYTTVFFFMKDFFLKIHGGDVGVFFSISSTVIIGVRLLGGVFFDRVSKLPMLMACMLLLAACFMVMGRIDSPVMLYPLAAWYGLCLGVILPLLNASMFLASQPHFRGLNTNLMLFMMDAGFFLAPYLGGIIVAAGYPLATLFHICAGLSFLNCAFLALLLRHGRAAPSPTG